MSKLLIFATLIAIGLAMTAPLWCEALGWKEENAAATWAFIFMMIALASVFGCIGVAAMEDAK